MRCLGAAACCVGWVLFVVYGVGLDTTSDIIRSSFYLAILGALVLPPTAGVLAIADRGLGRWKRVAAITVGIVVPAAAVVLFLAFLAALDQLN